MEIRFILYVKNRRKYPQAIELQPQKVALLDQLLCDTVQERIQNKQMCVWGKILVLHHWLGSGVGTYGTESKKEWNFTLMNTMNMFIEAKEFSVSRLRLMLKKEDLFVSLNDIGGIPQGHFIM